MPFVARGGTRRFAARAVKAAQFAFTGAERTALTEEAGGKAHSYGRKGKQEKGQFRWEPTDEACGFVIREMGVEEVLQEQI